MGRVGCGKRERLSGRRAYKGGRFCPHDTHGVTTWATQHVDRRRRFKPPKGDELRKELRHERKALASRYCQVFPGPAVAGDYLCDRIREISSDNSGGAGVTRSNPATTCPFNARPGNRRARACERHWGPLRAETPESARGRPNIQRRVSHASDHVLPPRHQGWTDSNDPPMGGSK